jgi:hypothetical protein
MAKKAKRKTSIKKNKTPALTCPVTVDFRTPHSTESSGKLASACAIFADKVTTWKAAVRKHYAEGGKASEVPQLDAKHFPKVNTGIQSMASYNKDVDRWNDGETVEFYPRYNPVLIDLVHAMNATTIRRGLGSKHPRQPSNWDEKALGPWHLLDDDGEHTIPSGWCFDKSMRRRCHAKRAEDLVDDPDKNILTFGSNRYVVGDGTIVRCAPMLTWATARGNYRAGDAARKRMSIAGNKDVVDVVFRIEDRANVGGGVMIKGDWDDVKEMVFLPGQALTAGFLFDAKGKRLSAKAIRGLAEDTKGLRFKTVSAELGGPIVGKQIARDKLWAEIQTIEGRGGLQRLREREGRSEAEDVDTTPQNKTMTNLKVTTRVSPNEAFPFGLRAAQCDMVPYILNDQDGEFSMGIVIGDRSNLAHNVGVNEAKADAVEEVEEVEEAPAPKKAKKAKKASKKKDAKPADAAPPVEADTADETEEEEVEETVEA